MIPDRRRSSRGSGPGKGSKWGGFRTGLFNPVPLILIKKIIINILIKILTKFIPIIYDL